MDEKNNKRINWLRVFFAAIFFITPILFIIIFRDKIFYPNVQVNSYNFWRFLWSLSCSFVSFSILVYHNRFLVNSPFPTFVYYYPFLFLIISSLVFSACHLFPQSSNYVFYYISFSFCSIFSYLADKFWENIISVIKKKVK